MTAGLADELDTLAAALDINDSVHFLGKVPRTMIPYMYANAAVYVSPSKLESFGLTVLEAMASGTPVVAADATTTPEICGDAASLFAPEDATSLADAIRTVLSDDDWATELTERGLDRVDQFDWERTASETKALLNRVLEED